MRQKFILNRLLNRLLTNENPTVLLDYCNYAISVLIKTNMAIDLTCTYVDFIYLKVYRWRFKNNSASQRPRCFDQKAGPQKTCQKNSECCSLRSLLDNKKGTSMSSAKCDMQDIFYSVLLCDQEHVYDRSREGKICRLICLFPRSVSSPCRNDSISLRDRSLYQDSGHRHIFHATEHSTAWRKGLKSFRCL